MISKEDVGAIVPAASVPPEQAQALRHSARPKPEGEGAVEIYCTVCNQPATDGRFSHYGPSMEWWHTITGTLDEIQLVYQTDRNYWDKVVAQTVRCGCGCGTPPCDPMKWEVRQVPPGA
ncbi:hypothetical protein [Gordonibacter massiliensis (ex Traore et al. 2017)]|uniref:hypothetical protein n=1 Tax=Gordonibacter massiliensis (ex Traore et al. 2017) TaxID=1841863 RepID=UPI001C8BF565|nr:hypothetical protein [Gordonibacter massiliensis (ex Traore et al. 2017)]MBX9034184.1 hypothetical protein [Gordonibacter massiliensis (ex Traore et al. 2017)]